MRKLMTAVLWVPLITATAAPASGQSRNSNRPHQNFDRGAYQEGRNGNYGYDRYNRYPEYDQRYHQDDQRYHEGGIGPGKGALIGAAGGAALGALFSGSAKGTIVSGAAGAGIGAILGQVAQNNRH